MRTLVNDLSSQSEVVIKQLMLDKKLSRTQAMDIWFKSKTKKVLEDNKLFYVSGMRCYWELTLELSGNENWMKESFE